MSTETKPSRTIPTPLVLALASAMICIGLVAMLVRRGHETASEPATPRTEVTPPHAELDTSTPEATAETFLDAWRKREHATTLALSIEQARREAEARKRSDEALSLEEARAAGAWAALAATRLTFVVERTTHATPGRVYLAGRAEGVFLGAPYVRRVAFEIVTTDDGFRISRMDLGTIDQDANAAVAGKPAEPAP